MLLLIIAWIHVITMIILGIGLIGDIFSENSGKMKVNRQVAQDRKDKKYG